MKLFAFLLTLFASVTVASANPMDLAIKSADIDFAACRAYQDGVATEANRDDLLTALGISETAPKGWSAGAARDGKRSTFAYVVAFNKPISAGSIFMAGDVSDLAYLPATAKAIPKNPEDAAWKPLTKPSSHQGGTTYTLPPGESIRALRVTDARGWGDSQLASLRIFKTRFQNITPVAMAYASREYYREPADFVPAFLFEAALVTKGTGTWFSAGLNKKQVINTPVISDISPEWFTLAWNEPQTLAGLWLNTSFETWKLEYYAGPDSINPRAGIDSEWRNVRDPVVTNLRGLWIEFAQPLTTRGLRFTTTKVTGTPQIASISGYHAFSDLAEKPFQDVAAAANRKQEKAPFQIPYSLAEEGFFTMVIKDGKGRTVRNLVSRRYGKAGKVAEPWDLKDEQGQFVPPGEYKWVALYHPRLQTKYEFTVYPNVTMNNPENSPWINGMNGSGGWMADHTAPNTICVAGDNIYMGSRVPESGVGLIETDSRGKKSWAHHSFAGFTGPENIAGDEGTVFVGATVLGKTPENIWTVDRETKEVKLLLTYPPTAQRRRGTKGLAAKVGKLYMSINASENWLANAAEVDDVDIVSCKPLYPVPRRSKGLGDIVADPRRDLVGLFRMNEHPPGLNVEGSLVYLQAEKSARRRQHIVLAFNRKVPIGSLCFPMPEDKEVRLEVSVLKDDAAYPPLAAEDSAWTPVPLEGAAFWSVIPLPENLSTRALRLSFTKGEQEDDLLANPEKNPDGTVDGPSIDRTLPDDDGLLADFTGAEEWQGRIEGMKLLRRRFTNVAGDAVVRVNSGKVAANGVWDAERDDPITDDKPGIYALEWKSPQSLRGLAIKEVDGQFTKIDVYEGPAGEIDIEATKGWQEITTYEQKRRDVGAGFGLGLFNGRARYVDGYVDFGSEIKTRAVRLRVVKQWTDKGQMGAMGIREDLGGGELNPNRCRIFGVAAVKYLGGEPAGDPLSFERIEVVDTKTGKLLEELPLAKPGRIAFDRQGKLHAISGNQIVRLEGKSKPVAVIKDLESPVDFAFDSKNNCYVFEAAAKKNQVRVYDATGKFTHVIGKPGGFVAGPWDPERMGTVTDLDVDSKNQLWVVENQYFPKRVTQWTTAGKFIREHLGNTQYGGAGVLDPWDKRRLFYGPLEFELDWQSGKSRLKNLTWLGAAPAGEQPIHIGKRVYMVNRPGMSTQQIGVVYLHDGEKLKPVAAFGAADAFDPLKQAALVTKAEKGLNTLNFIWSDINGNGEVEAEETTFTPRSNDMGQYGMFKRDLSLSCGRYMWVVKEFLPNGAPVYEEKRFAGVPGYATFQMDDGNFFVMGHDNNPEKGVTPEGELVWTYPSTGSGGHALYRSPAFRYDECVSELIFAGHESAGKEEFGEVLCFHTNAGQWTLWTHDGLFFGPIFRDMREPGAVPWSMKEHERGMMLTDITMGAEHFQANFCRSREDGKYYAVCGHNHISVVEVQGLDKAKRMGGTLKVSQEDLNKSQSFEQKYEAAKGYARAPVIDCYRLTEPPMLDGGLSDWPGINATMNQQARFCIGFTDDYLFVGYQTEGMGPFKNTGKQWDRLFKTGASVDLQIGVDEKAPLDRVAPVAGDQRLLMTWMDDKPIGVLYRPVAPEASPSDNWEVVSPVARASFDEVRRANGVQMVRSSDGDNYSFEAAIPLAELGWKPKDGQRLRMDWGVLVTKDGNNVLQRKYWANKATGIVADAPSEAVLQPQQWGYLLVHDRKQPSPEDQFKEETIATEKPNKNVKDDVDDILEALEGK